MLKEAVSKNIDHFPADSLFELTREEYDFLRTQFATLEREGRGMYSKYIVFGFPEKGPFAFTERGLNILASVSNSPKAVMEINQSLWLLMLTSFLSNTK